MGAAGLAAGEADGAGVDAACGGRGALVETESTSDRWRVMRVSIFACRRRSSQASGTGENATNSLSSEFVEQIMWFTGELSIMR